MDNAAVLLLSELYGTLKGGISSIYRRLAQVLRDHEPDIPVFSTVLEATEEDKNNAKSDGVRELLLPQVESGDERTKPSLHWLTFDHRAKYPHLPEKVKTIVGHTDGTSRAACGIKQDRCPEATAILFIDDIPEETEQYKGDEKALGIGKKEDSILKDAAQADVVFSIGDRIFDHFKNQFRAIPAGKQPQHIKFFPRPSSIFVDKDAEYKDTDTMVVLSISRVTGVEKLNGLDLAVKALSIVAEKMSVTLRVRGLGVNKDDLKARNAILGHRDSTNLQITFDPYGTQEDILTDMLQAHLVLVPSRAEPFGFVGLQAIAAGVPVLVSDKSGLANLIEKFARRYHNCIVKTDIHGNGKMNFNVSRWADRIEKVLEHCKEEFDTAANLKKDLLDTRYWEESERTFIEICKRKGPPSAEFEDHGTQDHGDSYKSGSDDDSPNFDILEIGDRIFKEEVLQDPQRFESKLLSFRRHFDATYQHFKKLSCKAKLRVIKKVANQTTKFNNALLKLSIERLETRYDKLVECFEKYKAILRKIEDGCVLCTLEFDDTSHLKSFLRGYRDGLLSETLTQELITEDMKQQEGPGLYVDVTLMVARDTAEADDDVTDEPDGLTTEDGGMQEIIAVCSSVTPGRDESTSVTPGRDESTSVTPGRDESTSVTPGRDESTSVTPGPSKNISRSLRDLHATKAQRGTLQPGLVSLNLATTIAQDSSFKDRESDPLINQLALRLAVKSRQAQESDRKAKRTIEILHTDVHKLTQEIETTAKMLADQNKEILRQQEANIRLTRTIEDLRAQKTSWTPTLEREEIRQPVEKADVDVYARDQRRKRLKLEESAFPTSEEESTTDTPQESLKAEAEDGRTTPHEASGHGATGAVELPRHGTDVQARDKNDDETALLEASRRGDTGEVELLIQHGADVQARDNDGGTALHLASRYGQTGVEELLIQHGADVKAKDNLGRKPLDFVHDQDHRRFLKNLASEASYHELMKQTGGVKVDRFKLCFCGPQEAGKSTLVESLQTGPFIAFFRDRMTPDNQPHEPTPGVNVGTTNIPGVGQVSVWDFAGQPEYAVTHSMFMNAENTIFIVLYNIMADIHTQKEKVHWWLCFIKSCNTKSKPYVILVASHADQTRTEGRQRASVILELMTSTFKDHLNISDEVFLLDCRKTRKTDMRRLKDLLARLKTTLLETPFLELLTGVHLLEALRKVSDRHRNVSTQHERDIPKLCAKILKRLPKWAKEKCSPKCPVLQWAEYKEAAKEIDRFVDEDLLKTSSQYLAHLGEILLIPLRNADPIIVLKPNWLCTDVFGKVMAPENFPIQHLRTVNDVVTKEQIQRVFQDVADVDLLITLLQEFQLCHTYDGQEFIIPGLLTQTMPPDKWQPTANPAKTVYLGRQVHCADTTDMFSSAFFPRVQTRLMRELKNRPFLWRDGAKCFDINVESLIKLSPDSRAVNICVRSEQGDKPSCRQMLETMENILINALDDVSPGTTAEERVLSARALREHREEFYSYSMDQINKAFSEDGIVHHEILGFIEDVDDLLYGGRDDDEEKQRAAGYTVQQINLGGTSNLVIHSR